VKILELKIFEFESHNPQVLFFIQRLLSENKNARFRVYARNDWVEVSWPPNVITSFHSELSILARYALNSLRAANSPIFVNTAPQFCRTYVKISFGIICLLQLLSRCQPVIVVRDWRKGRGFRLAKFLNSFTRVKIYVENRTQFDYLTKNGWRIGGVVPYIANHGHHSTPGQPKGRHIIRIGVNGSIDSERRDYDLIKRLCTRLLNLGYQVEVIILGHTMNKESNTVLAGLDSPGIKLTKFRTLTSVQLDNLLIYIDFLLCIARPEFYSPIKPSGIIRDILFSGKKALIHEDLRSATEGDAGLFHYFKSDQSLVKILCDSSEDALRSMKLDRSVCLKYASFREDDFCFASNY